MQQTELIKQVTWHYENHFNFQLTRLEQDSPVEYAITMRKLNQWIPDASIVADVGCGAGHYALHLARKKSQVHLIDLSKTLLKASVEKLNLEDLSQFIISSSVGSATQLDFIASSSVDAVILLGPLYHLITKQDRQKALHEASRILKSGGIIFASGINRLALLRDIWSANRFPRIKERLQAIKEIKLELADFMLHGISNATVCPHLYPAYFTTAAEFLQECSADDFEPLEFIGVESFTSHQQSGFLNKKTDSQSDWLDIIELSGRIPEGIAASEHFLFIGKKHGNTD